MRRFWSDRKGNVAIMFALATIPVVGAMGAALDYSLANAARTDIQKALDSTALTLTRMMPVSQATLDEKGMQFFKASLSNNLALSNLELTITPGTGTLHVEAKGDYTPKLAGILGIDTFPVGARTLTKWGIGKVEVALALDNTGSMSSSGKLTQLKAATNNLLDVLQASARNAGDAKVAIVPFDTMVNVGTGYVNASWLRWDNWEDENEVCVTTGGSSKKGKKGGGSSTSCAPASRIEWNGCVQDRDKDTNVNYDTLDTEPTNDATRFPASDCNGSLQAQMPLSYDWNALKSKVNSMTASGNTNVTIGLAWAWHLLSPTEPFTEGTAYGTANTQKFIILLTDGDNTQNRWSSSGSAIDARTEATCNNIKALKKSNGEPYIKIYTVRVINGNATLLRNCATDTSMYYDVRSASELTGVFNAIGTEIANLHLAK